MKPLSVQCPPKSGLSSSALSSPPSGAGRDHALLHGDLELEVTGGDEQTGLGGEELPNPIVVRVTGPDGPAPGILINFVVTTGGGHVFAGSALTNSAGEAKERWTLGAEGGRTWSRRGGWIGQPVLPSSMRKSMRPL